LDAWLDDPEYASTIALRIATTDNLTMFIAMRSNRAVDPAESTEIATAGELSHAFGAAIEDRLTHLFGVQHGAYDGVESIGRNGVASSRCEVQAVRPAVEATPEIGLRGTPGSAEGGAPAVSDT
jgi:hypothetical protein